MNLFDYAADIELGGMNLEVDIEYDVSYFTPATYMQPAEGGEVEDILGVQVNYVEGETYELTRRELGEWARDLDQLALEHVSQHFDRYELLEHSGSYE